MRSKNPELMINILDVIERECSINGRAPSMQEIADCLGISKACVSNYIAVLEKKGLVVKNSGFRGIGTKRMSKIRQTAEYLPVVGSVACGTPMLAEENIETYLPMPADLLGKGNHFILKASGDSMVNAGIENGDIVIIRQQNVAEEGQIIVALIDGEATLKRYYVDGEHKQIRLHLENDMMKDMYFKSVEIQGIAVKVIKDLC